MTYEQFYDIAEKGNKLWRGKFSSKEIAQNAYDYKAEYILSMSQGRPTSTMVNLCFQICEDMNFKDYADYTEDNLFLSNEQMENILQDFLDVA